MAAMTQGAIIALINAAKRVNTSAGWRSVKPFLALEPTAITLIDGDEEDAPLVAEFMDDGEDADD